jgi:transcriptional regulator with GAF, ATPase, and Fis domain
MATREQTSESGSKAVDGGAISDPARERHGLKEILEGVESDLILNALRSSNGNKAQAARNLGITERLMGIRVKRLGIDWRSLRVRQRIADRTF